MRVIVFMMLAAMLAGCQGKAVGPRALKPAEPVAAPSGQNHIAESNPSESFEFVGLVPANDLHPGEISNILMGLEYEPPNEAVGRNDVSLGPLGLSLNVSLTRESKVEDGVRISAVDVAGREYKRPIESVAPMVNGAGYYVHVPFENKPWSRTATWTIRVFCGDDNVLEKQLEVDVLPLLIFEHATDDPFQIIDVRQLKPGASYRLYYVDSAANVLIVYFARDYDVYRPIFVGMAGSSPAPGEGFRFTVDTNAARGQYHFTSVGRDEVVQRARRLPVFGYREIQTAER